MKRQKMVQTFLMCPDCYNVAAIHRKWRKQKAVGHIKNLWCYRCKKITKHVEYKQDYMAEQAVKMMKETMNMSPTVGRIVYYKSYGTPGGEFQSEDRAAIITKVHNATCVDLCVLNPTGLFFNQSVVQGSNGGQWDWMPYQKGQAAKTEELEKKLSETTN